MVYAADFVGLLLRQAGDRYLFGHEASPDDPDPDTFDCSELVEWGSARLGVAPRMPDGSWHQARHCKTHGTLTTVEDAITVQGALLFRFSHDPFSGGRPSKAHVAVNLGNGSTIEARGSDWGVGSWDVHARGWTHAALVPGLDYRPPPQPPAPGHKPNPLPAWPGRFLTQPPAMRGDDVRHTTGPFHRRRWRVRAGVRTGLPRPSSGKPRCGQTASSARPPGRRPSAQRRSPPRRPDCHDTPPTPASSRAWAPERRTSGEPDHLTPRPVTHRPETSQRRPTESQATKGTDMTDSLTAHGTPDVQRAAEYFQQWTILNPNGGTTEIQPGKRYLLKNSTNRHFLQYKEKGPGVINLGFSDDAEPSTAAKVVHWEFLNRDRTPVKYDQPVAIRCRDGYLHYGQRTVGINLVWSDNPVFQWRLLGGRPGTPVRTRDWLSIFNMHSENGEPLIYFKREIGGNIGWPSSKTLAQQGLDWAKDTVQKAVIEYLKSQAGKK